MAELKEKITYLAPEELIPYEYNPRTHESEVEYLKNSIQEFGFRNPILVDSGLVIIAGHGRRLAAMGLGLKRVPVIICDDLTEEQTKALRLADNKLSDISGNDWDMLNKELAELKDLGWDMERFAFEDMSKYDDVVEGTEPEVLEDIVLDSGTHASGTDYKLMIHLDDCDVRDALYDRLLDEGYSVQKLD